MLHKLTAVTILLIVLLAAAAGYRLVQSRIAAEVYRQRLTHLSDQYTQLRQRYNQVVAKTAATLLVVHDGKLTVVVRDADGTVKKIPTPYDPHHEIYVDYIVKDGRLWIRRVFDAQTPPDKAVVIDTKLGQIHWTQNDGIYGKAAYRALGKGVWQITVTGDGSLGLARCESCDANQLVAQPPVRSYEPMKTNPAAAPIQDIGPLEVLEHLFSG